MLLQYAILVLSLSIPHAFVRIWLAFAIWGLRPRLHARKLIGFAVVSSLLVDVDYLYLPPSVHAITSTCIVLALFVLVFRRLGKGTLAIVFLTYSAISMLADMLGTGVLQLLYGWNDRKELIVQQPMLFQSVYVPLAVATALLAYYMEKRNFVFFPRLYQYLLEIKQTRAKEVLFLTLLQAFLLGLLFALSLDGQAPYKHAYYVWLVSGIALLAFVAVFYSIRLMIRVRQDAISETREDYVEEIGRMFTAIRGQRHDFLNHLQVMSTMLQMNKLDQLGRYMKDLGNEAHSAGTVVAHASPAIAAFLSAKSELAIEKKIDFTYEVSPQLDLETVIKPIDLVKIVGNLVDNAFEESGALPEGRRKVHLAIEEDAEKLSLEVCNRGRVLTEEQIRKILLPGYTTKRAGHSGLGLAIVQERVQHYKGRLNIDSDSGEGLSFKVTLPRSDSA